ncbi:MAG: hypothetical protein P1U42_09910 [Phycisphaerales bacterium]|nr:hypothetical protein [Phycisphaerales bacterium]
MRSFYLYVHNTYKVVITCAERLVMVKETSLARSLAPEDIKIGTHVMTLHRQNQIMMGKCSELGDPEVVVIQVVTRPIWTELPGKVIAVCLPFVVIQRGSSKSEIIDTRNDRLALVNKKFAKAALEPRMKKKNKKSSKKRKKKKGK